VAPKKLALAPRIPEVIRGHCVYSDWGSVGKDNSCMLSLEGGYSTFQIPVYRFDKKIFACPLLHL
jgi:hypothetical protein